MQDMQDGVARKNPVSIFFNEGSQKYLHRICLQIDYKFKLFWL